MQEFSQAQIFLFFWIIGLLIGIIYDLFRSIRKSFIISNFYTNIQDLIFCALIGIIIIKSILLINEGQIRIYIFVALMLGTLIYYLTISRIVIIFFNYFFFGLKKCRNLVKAILKNITKIKGFFKKM